MAARNCIRFRYRGELTEVADLGPMDTLLDWLRIERRRTGTKEGCNEGDCGACTVALGTLRDGRVVYEPVNACIQLLGMIDGKELVTVDDLADGGTLHPVQRAMVEEHGSQCGFCTPGIVMSLFTLYQSGGPADRAAVNDCLAGNLCRCTGYRPIAGAALKACSAAPADAWAEQSNDAANMLAELDDEADVFIGSGDSFFAAPANENTLAKLYAAHPDATLVGGATDVGLWITKQLRELAKIIHTGRVKSLHGIRYDGRKLNIGAAATYAEAENALASIDSDAGELLRRLGSKQVRASGTLGGNIANGSPIGDSPPLLIALDARLHLRKGRARRTIALEDFFIAYGKQDRAPGELVTGVTVPRLKTTQRLRCYKISKRFDQDISAVLGAFRFTLRGGRIVEARIAFGGMAATPKRATLAEKALAGVRLRERDAWQGAVAAMAEDFAPIDDMRASAGYRIHVAQGLLIKALTEVAGKPSTATRVVGLRGGELERVA
jgi:xanthine dehydrogenase small subunit